MKRGVETALQKFTRRQFSVKQFKVMIIRAVRTYDLHGRTYQRTNNFGERSKIPRIEELYNNVI